MNTRISLVTAAAVAAAATADGAELSEPVQVTATRTPITADAGPGGRREADYPGGHRSRARHRMYPHRCAASPAFPWPATAAAASSPASISRYQQRPHPGAEWTASALGSATSGNAALEQLPVEQIQRIEVVRGPGRASTVPTPSAA
ncbi:MAG: hypothetical protein U5L11_16130 [Arhodomonas sp.]|nr:hypothetical protein [Arhodomonas sp.]